MGPEEFKLPVIKNNISSVLLIKCNVWSLCAASKVRDPSLSSPALQITFVYYVLTHAREFFSRYWLID